MKLKRDKFYRRLHKVGNSYHKHYVKNSHFNFNRITGKEMDKKGNFIEPIFVKPKMGDIVGNCGTVGCKMHLFGLIFPKDFEYIGSNVYIRGTYHYVNIERVRANYFGLNEDEFMVLFYPYPAANDKPASFIVNGVRIRQLSANATERQVNANINKFLRAKYK